MNLSIFSISFSPVKFTYNLGLVITGTVQTSHSHKKNKNIENKLIPVRDSCLDHNWDSNIYEKNSGNEAFSIT